MQKSLPRHRPPKPILSRRARARRGASYRWTRAGTRGAALRADRVFSAAEAKGGAAIDATKTEAGDLVVEGKKGLDAFPGTNLESLLKENGIETLALCGFLTNCCVESSMRTAYEKGT